MTAIMAQKTAEELQTETRNGIPASLFRETATLYGLSLQELAENLGIPYRTISRKLNSPENPKLAPSESEKVLRAIRIFSFARPTFKTEEGTARWMRAPRSHFNGAAPVEFLDTQFGTEQVSNLIAALQEGMVP